MAPTVSIIITNYNYGRFVAEAIEAALAQTYPHEEVVVVDDGSTDGSLDTIRRYGNVKVVEQENAGVARARNHGARVASGEQLVFLDADDRIVPEFVSTCVDALSGAGPEVAFAYTHCRHFGDRDAIEACGPFSARRLTERNYVHVTSLIRRAAFEAVGGFDASWYAWEDWELWLRMVDRGYVGVRASEAPMFEYRQHGASRNDLTAAESRALKGRLFVTYPRQHAHRLITHPLRSAGVLAHYARYGDRRPTR